MTIRAMQTTGRAPALTSFANPKLLHFLAAAMRAEVEGVPLTRVSGLDGANLSLFRAYAVERGFLDRADLVTQRGRSWVLSELEPFRHAFKSLPDLES